ncbi:MAG: long-chain-fatty-acid--CoA ligase [Gammaproteobacteria bacterium]|nr:long-chain-fatty-acid--CoA ligase [Gammaproteobacteria bacterium]TVQ49995.1 MAG: long-chain-fatty-acid--CoA ligase [Gammaproteobacteria bacterium]
MQGLMMDGALTITSVLEHAERIHGHQEIVSVTAESPRHRYTYRECFARARRLASVLAGLGIGPGDRVATLAWNDYRHMEVYYGVACSGAICHTINPRLFAEQLAWIVNHAEDRVLVIDPMFLPLVAKLRPQLPTLEQVIVLCSEAAMPAADGLELLCYETLLAGADEDFAWPALDERAAASLCYTSGTTGHPKGVLYSHRAMVLISWACGLPDAMNLSAREVVLPVVPMFHVNAWSIPYSALMVGAKLVMPGPKMGDGETLANLMDEEAVTVALGVPTVWQGLLEFLEQAGRRLKTLKRTVVGGSACPLSMMEQFEQRHGVWTHHAWGMTELSPLGTYNTPPPDYDSLPREARDRLRASQGQPVYGVEMKIVGPDGQALPWDGKAFGALKVRGPWVASSYYRMEGESAAHDAEGWFDTGDVATIDPRGYMTITDRTKDVIKSGGEWISSIELENIAVSHPAVSRAAVIGVAHPKWDERPLLLVVPAAGAQPSAEEILAAFEGKVARWMIPDAVEFIEDMPLTATGKISKLTLRERFAEYRLEG